MSHDPRRVRHHHQTGARHYGPNTGGGAGGRGRPVLRHGGSHLLLQGNIELAGQSQWSVSTHQGDVLGRMDDLAGAPRAGDQLGFPLLLRLRAVGREGGSAGRRSRARSPGLG